MDELEDSTYAGLADDSWSSVDDTHILFASEESLDEEREAALESEGGLVSWTGELDEAIERVESGDFEILVVGRELVSEVRAAIDVVSERGLPVALLWVDELTPEAYRHTVQLGFDMFVRRDIGPESFLRLIEQELRDPAGAERRGELDSPGEIIGASEEMRRVCRLISGAAQSTAPALISGESGVGKELVARAIHRLSPRRRRPFVALNCGAIPENLIESELFGHEEGAFTGATSSREGRFERADTGTLFLDEVGELPPGMQVKLLRVLEEQTFERVGGNESISVDVRILSATNRDLTVDIERDQFRRDLFFRLNVLEIAVPPLRDHRDDLPALWEYFVRRAAAKEAKRPPESSHEIRRKLYRYSWPGNVRELRNVARHAVALTTGDELRVEHLPERFRSELEREKRTTPGELQVPGMTLDEVERAAIIRTHEWTESAAETAKMLDISERKVYYKLKEYREQGFVAGEEDASESSEIEERDSGEAGDKPRLIIAEDDRQLQWTLRELLDQDYAVQTVTTGRQLVEEVQENAPDVILSDIRMPGLDGIQVLRQSHAEEWDIPIVLISAFGDDENRAQADLLGAAALLDKPVEPDRLQSVLRDAVESTQQDPT